MSNVWPFPPQRKLKERMEWMTEVIRSLSSEQRLCLRNAPRTTLELDYHFYPQEVEAATVMAREWGADEFYLPFWQELTHLGIIPSGTTTLTVDTTTKRYQANGFVFIMGADGSSEVVKITTVNSGSIELADPFVASGYSKAVIMPCFPARFKDPFQFRKYSAEYATGSAEFILTEEFNITEANSYPAFNGSYVLTDRPLTTGTPRESHTREFEGFQNLAGPLFYSKTHTYAVGTANFAWSFDTDEQVWSFRRWMYTVKGKRGSFYVPRWVHDFVVEVDITSVDEFLIVASNTYYTDSYIGPVCIVTKDGSQHYVKITSWEYFGPGQYQANLDSPIGVNIPAGDIELTTRLVKMRFNSDTIEYDYQDGGVVDVRLPIVEVPE